MSYLRPRLNLTALAIFVALLFSGTSLMAASYTWVGGDVSDPDDWNTPGNWAPSGTPGSSDDVTFNALASVFTVDVSSAVSVNSISVSGNYTFIMGGNIVVNDLDISSSSTMALQSSAGLLEVNGALTLGSGCHLIGSGLSSVFLQMDGTAAMTDLTASIGEKIYTDLRNANFMASDLVFYGDIDISNVSSLFLGSNDLYLGVDADIIGHTTDVGNKATVIVEVGWCFAGHA